MKTKKGILQELENLKNPMALNKVMTEGLKKTKQNTEDLKKTKQKTEEVKKAFGEHKKNELRSEYIPLMPARKEQEPIVFNTQEEANKYVGSLAKQNLDDLIKPTNFSNVARGEMQRFGIEKQYEAWEQSPYSGKSYDELTRLRSGIDGDLRRGKITGPEADKEKNTIDLWRVNAASKSELEEMRKEAEESKNYYLKAVGEAQRTRTGYNRGMYSADLADLKEKNQKDLEYNQDKLEVYNNLIAEIDGRLTDFEMEAEYDNTLLKFGEIAIKSGASDEYVPTKYAKEHPKVLVDLHDVINAYHNGNEKNIGDISQIYENNYDMLTKGELKLYNTLYNNNPEDAKKYLQSLRTTLQKRKADEEVQMWSEFADKNFLTGTLASAISVGQNASSAIPSLIDNTLDLFTKGKIDTNDPYSRNIRNSQVIRSTVGENWGKLGVVYSAGMSMIDNLVNIAAFGGTGAASKLVAANLASNAASSGMISAAERGGNNFQIITSGLANGLAEYIFEKYSLDKVFDIKSARGIGNIIKTTLAQSGVEASEEIFTETANILTDALIMQGKSENNEKLREYVMQGMSYEDASKKVLHDSITQIALAGASGFLAGGMMGGGATLINNASRASYITHKGEQMLKNPQMFNKVFEVGIANNNAEANYTAEMISDGLQVESKQAGKMLSSVIEQSIENDGGMINIMQLIGTIEGRGSSYIGSMESIDTAKAVMHMVQGKTTEVDNALLQRSDGATTLLTAIEGNEKAWSSVKTAANKELRSGDTKGVDAMTDTTVENPSVVDEHVTVKDGDVFTKDGKKATIAAKADVINGIVVNNEGKRFKKRNSKGYKVAEKMATNLKKPVKFVKGLFDAEGNQLDGVETDSGIFINTEGKNPVKWAVMHEFSHTVKKSAAKTWSAYENFVISKMKRDGTYYKVFEAKAKAYGTRDAAYINEEIACDYIGETFDNVKELADFIRQDRGLATKVRDFYYKALDKLGLLEEKKKAQLMWRDAYREAVLNVKDGKVESEGKSEPRFKINPTFERAFDNWVNNLKRKSGITLKVGSTSEALKSINVKDQTIYWSTTKINDTLKKHTDIDINTLKYIPNLIENPVLILRERPQYSKRENRGNNRIYLLGDLYNENGIPVMAFLELEPKDGEIRLDEIYVVSTHSRINEGDESDISYTQGLIDHSQLMYVDPNKNRTNNWLASTKLKMPFHPTTYGPINKITYSDDFVNMYSMQNRGKNSRSSISGTRLSDIEAENAELRAQMENMTLFNVSKSAQYGAEIRRAAQDIKSGYGSKINVSDLQKELGELYNYMVGKDTRNDAEVGKKIHSLAEKVIAQSTETVVNEEYSDLIDRIKTARIYVPESERADFKDGYEYFRKHYTMGKVMLANEGIELDVLWNELCEQYPMFFDENVTGSEERLERILEVREEIGPTEESIYHTNEEYRSAVLALENDIMESFYNIPKSDGGNKFMFYAKRAPMSQKALEESKERATAKKLSWNKNEVKKRIDSDYRYLYQMINNPTDARHVPEDMRGGVAYLLDCFRFETVQFDRIKAEGKEAESPTAVRLEKMYDAYRDIIRKAWGIDNRNTESNLLDEHLSEDLQELRDMIPIDESGEFKRIQDMSIEELRSIAKVLTAVHHSITQRNKAFNSAIKEEISELGTNSSLDLQNIRNKRKGSGERLDYNGIIKAFDKYLNFDNVQPWDFFHGMGGTMERLYMEERKAFNRHIDNIREASKVLQKATEGLNLKKLTGKNAGKEWFKLDSGEEIRLTKGQILSIYALYQRGQGKEHILGGGIVTNAESKNERGHKSSANSAHHVTEADLGKIFEILSEDEKRMVGEIVRFLSRRCAEWGNETSMKLYGYEKYGEGWYFPIKVSNQTLNTYYGEHGEGNLRSQGFTKKTVKNAKNAVEIGDFFDVVTNHINGMSLYNTVAIPMLDLERVLNYSNSALDDKVRGQIVTTFGKAAEKYIEAFHKDVNGSRKTDDKDKLIERLTANAKRASIGLNARVLLQQPTSIARIFLFMNPRDMPSAWNGVTLKKEMQENIPIAYWKSLGFRDIGTGSTMKEVLLDNESLYNKAAMGGYGMADDFTWSLIYGAVKNEIARKNPSLDKNSAEFIEKVRERFDYIVDRSQVVDSVFHRTQNMRSGNAYTKTATMFMSEPLKTFNMYRTEMLDAIKSGEVGKKTARATAVFVVSNLLLSIAQALPDAWREDDEKELFKDGKEVPLWDLILKKHAENMVDNSNPMTYLPYVKDIWSMIQGFTQERIEYSNFSDLIASGKGLFNSEKTLRDRILNFAKPAAAIFGVSAGNLIRDTKAIASTVYRMIGDEYNDYMLEKFTWNVKSENNKSKFMKHYKRALQNGHSEDAATILADYMAETFDGHNFENEHTEKVIGEMSKLYGKTECDSKLFYDLPKREFSFDKKNYSITDGEYPGYVEGAYKTLWDMAYEMVTDKRYKELSDEDKVRSFGEIKDYAQQIQRMEAVDGYELSGWEKDVYNGEMDYMDGVLERKAEREYQESRDNYRDSFEYDESKYSPAEIDVIEKVESDAASYYAAIEKDREYNEKTLRHIKVYDEKLSDEMTIEEYAGVRAYAKKTAAMTDGKESMKKNELINYLNSTDYSLAVKRALFEAIGNSNWKNPY